MCNKLYQETESQFAYKQLNAFCLGLCVSINQIQKQTGMKQTDPAQMYELYTFY